MRKPKSDEILCKQPKYFKHFSCIGGSCPYDCCHGWGTLRWEQAEVDKLKAADCSEKLKSLIDDFCVPVEDKNGNTYYNVKYTENGSCPMHAEDGLCSIQRELGADFLSNTCQVYPRKTFVYGDHVLRTMNLSCYEALGNICDHKTSMDIVCEIEKRANVKGQTDTQADRDNHPELKYRSVLFDTFYALIANESAPIEDRLIVGAIAAEMISQYIERGEQDRIPELCSEIIRRMSAPPSIDMDSGAQENFDFKFRVCGIVLREMRKLRTISYMMSDDGSVSVERYLKSKEIFDRFKEKKPQMMRNIALNMLFECSMPFFHADMTVFENYCFYAAIFASIEMLGAASAAIVMNSSGSADDEELYNAFKLAVATGSRSMFQTATAADKTLEVLREADCMSVPYIALLLKY